MTNRSPWIHQLNHDRERKVLNEDLAIDIAIIGAGIAGISTAFFLLKNTDKKIALIEGDKLAHGATGHNAGYMASYFERPFREIVQEFGLDMACQGQRDLDSAWELCEEMYTDALLDIHFARFESYAGLSTLEQLLGHLENDFLRRKGGLLTKPTLVWEDWPELAQIPEKYQKQIVLGSREEIALKLETFDPQYIAVLASQKGVMNSALFCQEVALYMLSKYQDRFSLYEHTPIKKLVVHEDKILLDAHKHTISAQEVVLCTNGFDKFDLITPDGLSLNTRFHHSVYGVVAFMGGYLEPHTGIPSAISYFSAGSEAITDNPGESYFYVSRRPYEYEKKEKHNLICVGGPDFELKDRMEYKRDDDFSERFEKAKFQINSFVRETYHKSVDLEYSFLWHGLMGYTKNLLRMVGPDPKYPHLYYNLGCNGLGLLPSIFGGKRVAEHIEGKKFGPSIFDIPNP